MPYRISTAILLYLIGFTYSRRSAERHQLCEICYCPYNISQDPYIINCKALNLANIPLWNDNSVIDNSEISNIHLELSYNALITIPLIAASENIQELDLSNSQISGIDPFAFAQLKCLKRLSLSNNNIEMLHPKTFNAATQEDHLKLEILDLSNNKIHHLDGDLFEDVPNLKELNLAVNPLGVLDVSTVIALNSVNGLQYLNMADTGVRELPDTLINPIQHLRKFNLSTNLLKRVPEVLQHGTKMTELILSNNLMQELDASSFVELDSLQTLEINNMPQLVIIHKGTFQGLSSLRTLRCNNNEMLSVIESGAFLGNDHYGTVELNKVELRSNNLTTVAKELLPSMSLTYLDLRDNPLNCSCDMDWMNHENATQAYLNETKCHTPPAASGKTLAEIAFDLECGHYSPKMFIKFPTVVANVYIYFLEAGLIIGFSILVVMGILIRQTRKKMKESNGGGESTSGPQGSGQVAFSNVRYVQQIDEDDE